MYVCMCWRVGGARVQLLFLNTCHRQKSLYDTSSYLTAMSLVLQDSFLRDMACVSRLDTCLLVFIQLNMCISECCGLFWQSYQLFALNYESEIEAMVTKGDM